MLGKSLTTDQLRMKSNEQIHAPDNGVSGLADPDFVMVLVLQKETDYGALAI